MRPRSLSRSFVEQIEQQINSLRDLDYNYRGLQLWVAGVCDPWQFAAADEFEFHDDVLIVRDGPTGEEGHDNADVPEYVFRLDAIVASQLV